MEPRSSFKADTLGSLEALANETLRRRVQHLTALAGAGRVLTQSSDVTRILNRALEEAVRVTGADCGSAFLLDLASAGSAVGLRVGEDPGPATGPGKPAAPVKLPAWTETPAERRQVRATYHCYPREFCPYALGTKGDRRHCLVYQFGGRSTSGPIIPGSPGNWRCFDVGSLSDVAIQEGPWIAAPNWDPQQVCVDAIDVLVTEP